MQPSNTQRQLSSMPWLPKEVTNNITYYAAIILYTYSSIVLLNLDHATEACFINCLPYMEKLGAAFIKRTPG